MSVNLLIIILLILNIRSSESRKRDKRFLLFPPLTAPAKHEIILGIGIPLELEHESLTAGWTLKTQYFLPYHVNQLKPTYFPGLLQNFTPQITHNHLWHPFPGTRLDKRNVDFEEEILEQIPDEPGIPYDILKFSRWDFYDKFAFLFGSQEFGGRSCLLRTICEATSINFAEEGGLLAEILHIIFSPSTTQDLIKTGKHHDYKKAEDLGRTGEPCARIFAECPRTFFDFYTETHDDSF